MSWRWQRAMGVAVAMFLSLAASRCAAAVALDGAAGGGAVAAAGATAAAATLAAAPPVQLRHVALDLQLDWAARAMQGTATLTLALRRNAARIELDAVALEVSAVSRLDGAQPTALPHATDAARRKLLIELERDHAAGDTVTLQVAYRTRHVNASDPHNLWGSNGRGVRFHVPNAVEPTRRRQVWASGEPGSAAAWYPGLDAPGERHTSELRLTVAAPLQVVASGRLAEVVHHNNGRRTYHWKTEAPSPGHRLTFVAGEFVEIPQHHERVALLSYGYPDEAAGVAASVVMLPDTLRWLEQITGVPYPHASYSQAFVQELPWNTPGAGFSANTENMVDDHGTHLDFQYLWDGLQTESLAQQWFGGHVAVCDWRHAWLERGLAHHLAALYTEHRHGRDELLLWYLQANQATALADAATVPHDAVVPAQPADLAAFATGNAPYARAAVVLHMLRAQVGDAAWRRALRLYAQRHAGGTACTADLQHAVEAAAGRPMGWFFEQWIYRAGHPVFEVSWQWQAQARRVQLVVKQVQKSEVGFFQGAVVLQIDGRTRRVWLASQAENRFSIAAPEAPRLVHFDRESVWLKELRFQKGFDELLHQLRHTDDAAARQWAMRELAQRLQPAADAPAPEGTLATKRAAFEAALRDVIAAPHYWRVRFNALQQLVALYTPGAPAAASASAAPPAAATPVALVPATEWLMLKVVAEERSWLRTSALRVLSLTRDTRHAALYLRHLHDDSDRVVNAAAVALGRSGSEQALAALMALPKKPSWKNQSLISALNGLKELGDARGGELALSALADLHAPRWTLSTPVWDFRLAAAETLAALGRGGEAVPMILARFDSALAAGELNDIFSQVHLLLALRADARAERVFEALKQRYGGEGGDAEALKASANLERSWRSLLAAGGGA